MIRKGIRFRKANHLHYRYANPEIDKEINGEPLSKNYVVITRWKDCLDDEGNYDEEKALQAPCVPNTGHSRTNMLYGSFRKHERSIQVWVGPKKILPGDIVLDVNTIAVDPGQARFLVRREKYWTLSVYWVEDGVVYQGTIQHWQEPIYLIRMKEAA
jgi:hypothetical protein